MKSFPLKRIPEYGQPRRMSLRECVLMQIESELGFLAHRALEVLKCKLHTFIGNSLLPVYLNFLISTCVTSLACIILVKFEYSYTLLTVFLFTYLCVVLEITVVILYQLSKLTMLSEKMLRAKRNSRSKYLKLRFNGCRSLAVRIGSFHTVNLNVLGIVLHAIVDYTIQIVLNLQSIWSLISSQTVQLNSNLKYVVKNSFKAHLYFMDLHRLNFLTILRAWG